VRAPAVVNLLRGDAVGALVSFGVAAALFSRFGLHAHLWRDEAIYAYGGQQFADGVPFYASIFDIKTPLASQIAGLGVLAGRAVGADDLDAIRVTYFLGACAAVAVTYLLAARLWRSPLAGYVAAAVLASFSGFAIDAGGGPNAKTFGVLFAVGCMALAVRGRWFWAALVGSLGFLVWQPLLVYPALVVVAAWLAAAPGRRRGALARALAGAALPVAVTAVYFLAEGAFSELVEAAFVFPVTGLARGHSTLGGRIDDIASTLKGSYGIGRVFFWAGLPLVPALLVVRIARERPGLRQAIADPLACVVVPSLVLIAVFSLIDFEGYPDLYPGLPYAAIGVAGLAALLVELAPRPSLRQVATAGGIAAVLVLVGFSWWRYTREGDKDHGLAKQRANAAAIERILAPGERLYALGDPTPLVLTQRRNPSRFIYLSSGVGLWVKRHSGWLPGWIHKIRATDPAVIVVHGWTAPLAFKVSDRLAREFEHRSLHGWQLFVKPDVAARAPSRGVTLQPARTPRA
jgi:hypothetical protein